MYSIFQELVKVLIHIRTPLIFWSFCILLVFFSFYVFLKNSKGGMELAKAIVKKLDQAHLYKTIRLLFIIIFVLFTLTAVLAFAAPLLNSYLEANRFNEQLSLAKEDIIDNLELERKYNEIIECIHNENIAKARELMIEAFGIDSNMTTDEFRGYLAATYSGLSDYENAAIEVIKRDSTRKRWDYSLQYDMVYCLRLYAVRHSAMAASNLVDHLLSKYSNKLLSHVWPYTPLPLMVNLKRGMHSYSEIDESDGEFRSNIQAVIEKFPKDPFIDHAYYLVGDYEKALKLNPNSRIKDVITYAIGYKKIRKYIIPNGYDILPDKELSPKVLSEIADAKQYFKSYIKLFPKGPHADDSSYWLAWIEFNHGNIDAGASWLNKTYALEQADPDVDFTIFIPNLLVSVLKKMPAKAAVQFLKKYDFERSEKYSYWSAIVGGAKYEEAIHVIELADLDYRSRLLLSLAERELDTFHFQEARKAALLAIRCTDDESEKWSANEIISKADILTKSLGNDDMLVRSSITLKSQFGDRLMADYALSKASGNGKIFKRDYIEYLRIINSKDWRAEKMPELVDKFKRTFPNSVYADDVLAELAYTYLYVYEDGAKGEVVVNEILKKYPKGNSCDNALRWLASYYYDCSYFDEECKIKATQVCQLLIKKYPLTRHAVAATSMINNMEERKSVWF